MIRPLQTTVFPRIGSQQATAMQAGVLPTTAPAQALDISALMNLMITMMIVVMMMKMMTGMMASVTV